MLQQALSQKHDDKDKSKSKREEISLFLCEIVKELKANNKVLIPTDKTNGYALMTVEEYASEMEQALLKTSRPIDAKNVKKYQHEALNLLEETRLSLSAKEYQGVLQQLKSCKVPTPRLLVKDHKQRKESGTYPCRLVVPADSFISGFTKIGYLTVKEAFLRNNINIETNVIQQASTLKKDLIDLNLDADNNYIASIDIVDFYPSVSYKMIEKAVWHYASDLPESEKARIATGLSLLKAGMSYQILSFQDKYYEYQGADATDPGLTIGGYESAFCSDLVVAFVMDKMKKDKMLIKKKEETIQEDQVQQKQKIQKVKLTAHQILP